MKLVQVNKHIVTSGNETQVVSMTGISDNSVYMLTVNNLNVGADGGICDLQPLTSGSVDTTNNIAIAWTLVRANNTYQNFGNTPQDIFRFTDGMSSAPASLNATAFLYNWFDANEYSYVTIQPAYNHATEGVRGHIQAGVKKEQTSHNGININTNQSGGGGFQAGSTFVLYKVDST
tara:strand:+ start:1431 stop:1958 length:528 start_codon:yes stop_codon:yes gene_type:complete